MSSDTTLPQPVTAVIAERVGAFDVVRASNGHHAEFAARILGQGHTLFVKAARSDFGVRSLRYETQVSRAVGPPVSPAVEWHCEVSGWLVVAFEYCAGPHADLAPGSPNLELLAAAVDNLGRTPAPDQALFSPAARLGFELAEMEGDTLVHTDLNATNLIVTQQGLRIADWAMAAKAAPWVELALLVPWLIGSGHTPEQTDEWLARFSVWRTVDPAVVAAFANRNAEKWLRKAQENPAAWKRDLAEWTGRWSAYQRGKASATQP
ncbi:hypothetical protein Q0Z83_112110 [Actinoplanes sichuanensis]|uniref:Aminoglycoside phosphotransferase n=1 Tax=Actinoplanes sichuanensis TaxID=512349 RepID=A0ABW4A239_9ACTN|nr:aminoglycoside phosphotransferase [Actinoplanes sichuanensis]BEL13020.1 hypothetical protein Q0Z83_112110 [Actinoplanes sichuanensis]